MTKQEETYEAVKALQKGNDGPTAAEVGRYLGIGRIAAYDRLETIASRDCLLKIGFRPTRYIINPYPDSPPRALRGVGSPSKARDAWYQAIHPAEVERVKHSLLPGTEVDVRNVKLDKKEEGRWNYCIQHTRVRSKTRYLCVFENGLSATWGQMCIWERSGRKAYVI